MGDDGFENAPTVHLCGVIAPSATAEAANRDGSGAIFPSDGDVDEGRMAADALRLCFALCLVGPGPSEVITVVDVQLRECRESAHSL